MMVSNFAVCMQIPISHLKGHNTKNVLRIYVNHLCFLSKQVDICTAYSLTYSDSDTVIDEVFFLEIFPCCGLVVSEIEVSETKIGY